MLIQSALVALAATAVTAVKPIEVRGNEFYVADSGERFQMVGMGYQPGGSAGYKPEDGKDPLTDVDACLRDAALMQILGINTVRVYNLDPDLNHDECVSIFNAAGMYMVIDVNSPLPGEAITAFEPWKSYYMEYLNRTFAVVEAFAEYPNTLLFFSGNEIIQDEYAATNDPPYIRAVTRDLKNYIKNNLKRTIPVGYSAADYRKVLYDTWNYCQCAEDGEQDDMSRSDIFGLNSYSWCGDDATYKSSTYEELTTNFKSTSIPVFFSEYGCNQPKPHHRQWDETQALYGDKMTPTFSGGLVYEWTEEEKEYGLINITGDTAQIMSDYTRLKNQFAKIDWKSLQTQKASKKDIDAPKCDSKLIQQKIFNHNFTLPVVPPGAQDLIDNGIKNKRNGKLVKVTNFNVKMAVKDEQGNDIKDLKVVQLDDDEFNWPGKNKADTGKQSDDDSDSDNSDSSDSSDSSDKGDKGDSSDKDDKDDAAMLTRPLMWAVALPALAMFFA